MVAFGFMNGCVSDASEIVKQRALGRADDIAVPKAIDELLLPLLGAGEETYLRGRALREDFTELPQLEEHYRGVAREMLLRLRCERNEPRVVVREIGEVGGGSSVHG